MTQRSHVARHTLFISYWQNANKFLLHMHAVHSASSSTFKPVVRCCCCCCCCWQVYNTAARIVATKGFMNGNASKYRRIITGYYINRRRYIIFILLLKILYVIQVRRIMWSRLIMQCHSSTVMLSGVIRVKTRIKARLWDSKVTRRRPLTLISCKQRQQVVICKQQISYNSS